MTILINLTVNGAFYSKFNLKIMHFSFYLTT